LSFSSLDSSFASPKPKSINDLPTWKPPSNPAPKSTATVDPTLFNRIAGAVEGAGSGYAGGQATTPVASGSQQTIPDYTPGGFNPTDGGLAGFDTSVFDNQAPQAPSTPQAPFVDLNALLQKALSQMGFSQLDSSLQKAREQLITKFGDSSLAGLAGFGLDPQAGAFAQQNYMSGNADLARLDKQRDKNKQAVINRLAAHGILFSGDLGHGLNEAESQYGNSRYDLTNSYLQQLQALLDNTLQQKQSLRSNVVNALLSAYGNQTQNPDELVGLYGG
jgi:hypothetical protein